MLIILIVGTKVHPSESPQRDLLKGDVRDGLYAQYCASTDQAEKRRIAEFNSELCRGKGNKGDFARLQCDLNRVIEKHNAGNMKGIYK
jgi:hypothetical protein